MYRQKKLFPGIQFFLFAVLVSYLLSACVTTQSSGYFKNIKKDTSLSIIDNLKFEQKIESGDILAIKASSLSAAEDIFFNAGGSESAASGGEKVSAEGFLVADDGTVMLHRLGKVKAAGTTRKDLAARISRALEPAYMKDVIVTVNFLNKKITVMGAVGSPQVIPLANERMSIIDALVSSGDITEKGNYKDVMVIREEKDGKLVKHLNLEDRAILTSAWYYLQAGDIVYVQPDYEKEALEQKQTKMRGSLTFIMSAATFALIIIDRIIR